MQGSLAKPRTSFTSGLRNYALQKFNSNNRTIISRNRYGKFQTLHFPSLLRSFVRNCMDIIVYGHLPLREKRRLCPFWAGETQRIWSHRLGRNASSWWAVHSLGCDTSTPGTCLACRCAAQHLESAALCSGKLIVYKEVVTRGSALCLLWSTFKQG